MKNKKSHWALATTHSEGVPAVGRRTACQIHSDRDERTPTSGVSVWAARVTPGLSGPSGAQASPAHCTRGPEAREGWLILAWQ